MTRWLAAARKAGKAPTKLTQPTKPPAGEVSSVVSVLSEGEKTALSVLSEVANVASVADVAGGAVQDRKTEPSAERKETPFPYGTSPGGRPLTCTGRVVSLNAWRSLTEWERHGPDGRRWNGKTREWEIT